MPQPTPAGMRLGLVPPQDAAAAFARRGLLPSFRWQDVFQEEHARAFAVAGVMRLDILQIFRTAIDKALNEGQQLADYRKALREQLVAKGFWGDIEITDQVTGEIRTTRFDDRRLRLIYDVNLRQSQAAGRWARIERLKKRFPFVTYRTMRDERVRKSHAQWDGVTLPVDDPWWNTHYPPNGWMCRCQAYGIDEAGIAKLEKSGVKVKRKAPETVWKVWHNPQADGDAAFVPIPHGIDPGFAYNPGKERDASFFDVAMQKAQRTLPREAAVVVTQALHENPLGVAQVVQRFGAWVDDVLAAKAAYDTTQPRATAVPNTAQWIGVIHPWAWDRIVRAGVELLSPVIGVTSDDVIHAILDKNPKQVLPVALYKRLPLLLTQASSAYLDMTDKERPVLLYVIDVALDDGRIAKLVLELDDRRRVSAVKSGGQRGRNLANWVRTAGLMRPESLDQPHYVQVWGGK